MPELPDVTVYVERLTALVHHQQLERVRLIAPFLLRTVSPPLSDVEGKVVLEIRRLGKRIVIGLEDELFLVLHLMIAGRLRLRAPGRKPPGGLAQAAFDFPRGTLWITEAGAKRRASLHVVRGAAALAEFNRGGIEVSDVDVAAFRVALTRENHTLKRALTDPTILSGIGNAFSDEILHRARLSPLRLTDQLDDDEMTRLYEACRITLDEWTARLRTEVGEGFPEKVTAFREGMAVHGRYRMPCPVCGSPVQRIRYADNETNYCATCQTGGRLLADRGLSRLLRQDWPQTLEEMEEVRRPRAPSPPRSPGTPL